MCYLQDSMNCASDLFKYLCNWVLENCSQEMEFVRKRIDNTCSNRLNQIISGSLKKLTYHEAIEALKKVGSTTKSYKKQSHFDFYHYDLSFQRETKLLSFLMLLSHLLRLKIRNMKQTLSQVLYSLQSI